MADLELERKLRHELRAVKETRIALELLGLLSLERELELEREKARIRSMIYELEKKTRG